MPCQYLSSRVLMTAAFALIVLAGVRWFVFAKRSQPKMRVICGPEDGVGSDADGWRRYWRKYGAPHFYSLFFGGLLGIAGIGGHFLDARFGKSQNRIVNE